MAIRCSTPSIRTPLSGFLGLTQYLNWSASFCQLTKGYQFKNNPIKKINNDLVMTFFQNAAEPAISNLGNTKAIALPTANKKKGNTRSVGVIPCHFACSSGLNICDQEPGLFTSIIRQTVAPRNTSRE